MCSVLCYFSISMFGWWRSKGRLLHNVSDRNTIMSEIGQKNDGPNEKPWKVYVRRKKQNKSEGKNGKGEARVS